MSCTPSLIIYVINHRRQARKQKRKHVLGRMSVGKITVSHDFNQMIYTSHKKVFQRKTSACRDGALKNKPNKMRTTPQHIHTIPTSCAILPTMLCVFVSCVHSRVVEGVGREVVGV